jgi:branched-chain amino acid transport system permease protein
MAGKMGGFPFKQWLMRYGWVAILAAIPFVIKSSYVLHMVIMIVLFACLGEAWNVIGGYAGQLSLGHAVFFGLGSYASTLLYLRMGVSPWIGCIVGMGLAVLLSIIIGAASFRLKGPYFALVTLAFAEVVLIITQIWGSFTSGALGLAIPTIGDSWIQFQFSSKAVYFYVVLAIMVFEIMMTNRIERSKLGYYLIAIREEEIAASCLGIGVFKYKLRSLIISAVFTSLLGSFYAQYMRFIHPHSVFGFDISLQIILVSLVGGPGTVYGPIIGAFIMIPLSEVIRAFFGGGRFMGLHYMIYGLVLVLVVLFLPGGIVRNLRGFKKH